MVDENQTKEEGPYSLSIFQPSQRKFGGIKLSEAPVLEPVQEKKESLCNNNQGSSFCDVNFNDDQTKQPEEAKAEPISEKSFSGVVLKNESASKPKCGE